MANLRNLLGRILSDRSSLSIVCISIFVFSLLALFTSVEPRPYHLSLYTDVENDYLCNIRRIASGYGAKSFFHPAVPPFYMGAAVMKIVGTSIEASQLVLWICYWLVGISMIIGFLIFRKRVLKEVPPSYQIIAFLSAFTWPSIIVYVERYSGDSFALSLGFAAFGISWAALAAPPNRKRDLWVAGIFGLCLTTKITFLPFALMLLALHTFHHWIHHRWSVQTFRICLWTLFSYLFWHLPEITKVHYTASVLVGRIVSGEATGSLWDGLRMLTHRGWYFSVIMSAFGAIGIGVAIRSFQKRLDFKSPEFFHFSLLACVGIGFFYFLSATPYVAPDYFNEGIPYFKYRQPAYASPLIALCLGFIWTYGSIGLKKWMKLKTVQIVFLLIVFSLSIFHVRDYRKFRTEVMEYEKELQADNRAELMSVVPKGTRVAVYMEHPGNELGIASFHHWGNYRFCGSKFDLDLSRIDPELSMFGIKDYRTNSPRLFISDALSEAPPLGAVAIVKKHLHTKYYFNSEQLLDLVRKQVGFDHFIETDQYYVVTSTQRSN